MSRAAPPKNQQQRPVTQVGRARHSLSPSEKAGFSKMAGAIDGDGRSAREDCRRGAKWCLGARTLLAATFGLCCQGLTRWRGGGGGWFAGKHSCLRERFRCHLEVEENLYTPRLGIFVVVLTLGVDQAPRVESLSHLISLCQTIL
jgi:hypothetical protein